MNRSLSSTDYVRFKPGRNRDDGNIFVTLGIVKWSMLGGYSKVGDVLYPNITPAPTHEDSIAFPTWEKVYTEGMQ
jgi:hypothetical protein